MNKFILIAFIISSNFLLLSKTLPSEINDKSQKSIEDLGPIKITPLYIPDLEYYKEKHPEVFEEIEAVKASQLTQKNKTAPNILIKPPQWILESSIHNAPELLKGILFYLQLRRHNTTRSQQFINIPSFHRFILVGPPGTGKTTLARTIAHMLDCSIIFIPATSLLGHFRNETANNIQKCLREYTTDGLHKVIIIDELHKLFEHHADERTDDSQSAAAFWLFLDNIEQYNPNAIIIGTANSVDKLPPEIKSRFSGKIITMPVLNKNQKIRTFKKSIAHDRSVIIDDSVSNAFIAKMLQQIQNCSLRDVQLIIDSAKMFYYAEQSTCKVECPIILNRIHFQRALDQLQAESHVLQESAAEKIYKKIKKWGVPLSVAVNILICIKESMFLLKYSNGFLNN